MKPLAAQGRQAHVFIELAHQALIHIKELGGRGDSSKHWNWNPLYKRPPRIIWSNGAVLPPFIPKHRIYGKTSVHDAAAGLNRGVPIDPGSEQGRNPVSGAG